MATTTPNFGWAVPTSTDLVKDGAVAIETLGDSIDASLVDLKGGTTGQVLAKASGTDMDFSWVAQDDSNAIQNAIVDAKGDLIAASANDTPARLAVGANGETLVADSSTSTGLRYQAIINRNSTINGCMDIWQRGTSIATGTSNVYTADRWQAGRSGAAGLTVTRQATGDTTNLPFVQYAARVSRDSGNTATDIVKFYQSWESVNSIPYAGRTVTFSFYARRGANFSATSNNLEAYLLSGTGTDENVFSGFTGQATVGGSASNALTTTWQRFQFTGTVASTATQLGIRFYYSPTGTAGAADYFEVTGVQVEVGSVATQIQRNGATLQTELAACQRYYLLYATDEGTRKVFGNANYYSATQVNAVISFPVQMRTAPTLSATSGTDYYGVDRNGGVDYFNSLTIFRPSPLSCMLYNSSEASGTAGNAGVIFTNNSLTVVALSAEL
jgi:hypothetical protein